MPPELVGFTVVASLVALLAVAVAIGAAVHRRGQKDDPATWTREVLEPWGSIVIAGLVAGPLLLGIGRAIGVPAITPLVYLLAAAVVVHFADVIGGVRRVTVDAGGVRWQTLRRSGTVPLDQIVGYQRRRGVTRIQLADGTSIVLDHQPKARELADAVAHLAAGSPLPRLAAVSCR